MTTYDFLICVEMAGWLCLGAFVWVVCHIVTGWFLHWLSPSTSTISSEAINSNCKYPQDTNQNANKTNNPEEGLGECFRQANIVKERFSKTSVYQKEKIPVKSRYRNGYPNYFLYDVNQLWREHIAIMKDTLQLVNQIIRRKERTK